MEMDMEIPIFGILHRGIIHIIFPEEIFISISTSLVSLLPDMLPTPAIVMMRIQRYILEILKYSTMDWMMIAMVRLITKFVMAWMMIMMVKLMKACLLPGTQIMM